MINKLSELVKKYGVDYYGTFNLQDNKSNLIQLNKSGIQFYTDSGCFDITTDDLKLNILITQHGLFDKKGDWVMEDISNIIIKIKQMQDFIDKLLLKERLEKQLDDGRKIKGVKI